MRQKILAIIAVLFGLMMINAGLNKFFNYMPIPENMPAEILEVMGAFMKIKWLFPLIAVIEILGGILFAIPRFRALGAIVILPILIGIVLHHTIYAPEGLLIALTLFAIDIWAIVENWNRYVPMIESSQEIEN